MKLLKTVDATDLEKDPFDPNKLDGGLLKWSAAGFATLSSVLTFLGITGGYLNRILGQNPTASLWIFILVGLGVVASLAAAATKSSKHIFDGWVVAAILALGGISALLFKNYKEAPTLSWTVLAIVVLLGLLGLRIGGVTGIWRNSWQILKKIPIWILVLAILAILAIVAVPVIAIVSGWDWMMIIRELKKALTPTTISSGWHSIMKDLKKADVPTTMLWAMISFGLVTFVVVTKKRWTVSLPAALLAFAVVATSMGLYGAVKLSVAQRAAPQHLAVRAKVAKTSDGQEVQVTVRASQQEDTTGRVEAVGSESDEKGSRDQIIASQTFRPDDTGTVSEDLTFPLDLREWERVTIQGCIGEACKPTEYVVFAFDQNLHPPSLGGSIRIVDKTIQASVEAIHLRPVQYLLVFVQRGQGSPPKGSIIRARAIPKADGSVRWAETVHAPTSAKWRLWARVCGETKCGPFQRLATSFK